MKSYVIAIPGHEDSQKAADTCIKSSVNYGNNFEVNKFDAVTPDQVDSILKKKKLKWNYPWEGVVLDFNTGLKKSAYATKNRKARIACALSHYQLWENCHQEDIPYLILEHDAIFISKLNYENPIESHKLIISINNPKFATRKAGDYHNLIKSSTADGYGIVSVPNIDEMNVPQGLPGNSAYIIKPEGARRLIKLVEDYGLWPNDALMCKQLIPRIGCTQKYYTRVQGVRSTTTF